MNDEAKPAYSHISHHHTRFECAAGKLLTGPIVISDRAENEMFFLGDMAEFIGFHATVIWPELDRFNGYDCLKFVFSEDLPVKED